MGSKFADAVVVRFGKGKPMEKSPPADDGEGTGGDAAGKDDDAPTEKPGQKGKMLIAAFKKGDGESVEELVKSICGY